MVSSVWTKFDYFDYWCFETM
uniref:Uncharacterized protein n=1 Tax=Arundo donax TaxID=35708 RepID=A0A0A9APC1_ARUDO